MPAHSWLFVFRLLLVPPLAPKLIVFVRFAVTHILRQDARRQCWITWKFVFHRNRRQIQRIIRNDHIGTRSHFHIHSTCFMFLSVWRKCSSIWRICSSSWRICHSSSLSPSSRFSFMAVSVGRNY